MKIVLLFWPQFYTLFFLLLSTIKSFLFAGTVRSMKITRFKIIQEISTSLFGVFVIYCGGFFNYFGGAQWIYLILVIAFQLFLISGLFAVPREGKASEGTVSDNFFYIIAIFILFYWGGYFDSLIQFIK